MYISLWKNSRGHPDNISFMQFSTKIDGFEQKDSQGFENSYNSYEQYPLEKFFIFTIYQNYTLALIQASNLYFSLICVILLELNHCCAYMQCLCCNETNLFFHFFGNIALSYSELLMIIN